MDAVDQPAWILPVNYLNKQESRCEKTFALLVEVMHCRRLVWDKENRENEMCTRSQATVQALIFTPIAHKSSQRLCEREGEIEMELSQSFQSMFNSFYVCVTLFLNTIELPNTSLLDNWKTCHFVIWHALYENQSYIFNAVPDKRGFRCSHTSIPAPSVYVQPCVCLNVCLCAFFLLLLCFWVLPLYYSCICSCTR